MLNMENYKSDYKEMFAFHQNNINATTDDDWNKCVSELMKTAPNNKFLSEMKGVVLNELERNYYKSIGKEENLESDRRRIIRNGTSGRISFEKLTDKEAEKVADFIEYLLFKRNGN